MSPRSLSALKFDSFLLKNLGEMNKKKGETMNENSL